VPAPGNSPPRNNKKEINVDQGGCVPYQPDPILDCSSLLVLYCSAYLVFNTALAEPDGAFMQFVCQFFNLMVNPDQGVPEVSLYSLCR
jgi:hypothetical protein